LEGIVPARDQEGRDAVGGKLTPSLIGTATLCRTPTPNVAAGGVQAGSNGDGLLRRGRPVAALSLDRNVAIRAYSGRNTIGMPSIGMGMPA
jgi:hypothetical protein